MPAPTWSNLPNRITLSRIVLSFALFALLCLENEGVSLFASRSAALWTAAIAFAVCVSTDWLDGWLARRRGETTTFGRIADPFADKLLVLGTLICMMPFAPELVPPWFVVALLAREFLVSGLRSFLESQGVPFGARWGGKVKMVLQSVFIPVALADAAIAAGSDGGAPNGGLRQFGQFLFWATLAATMVSMFVYLQVARGAVAKKERSG